MDLLSIESAVPWVGLIGTVGIGMWRISSNLAKRDAENDARHAANERAIADSIVTSRARHDRTESAIASMAMSVERLTNTLAAKTEQTSAALASIEAKLDTHHEEILMLRNHGRGGSQ